MIDISTIEASRLAEQVRIDALKTSEERNRLGQFATPPALAFDIARYARRRWGKRGPVRFLDPAIGTGAFFSALRRAFSPEAIAGAAGVEVDPAFVAAAGDLWRGELEVIGGDFTELPRPKGNRLFNLVLTNPPYVRHHHLGRERKARLQAAVARELGLEISGLAGLYCYFLLLADLWMAERGLAAWLIPTEFMEVNYGVAVKGYLTDRVKLIHVHRFCPSDVQFCDALVTSAVVLFEKVAPSKGHGVRFSFGSSLTRPTHSEIVSLHDLRDTHKWTDYPRSAGSGYRRRAGATLGDLFTIKRGLATGSNSFFIVPYDQARREFGIPDEALRPILPSPRHLPESVVERRRDGYPRIHRPLALIDTSLPEEEIRSRFPDFWSYLERGLSSNIHTGYLTSRRSPWYSQEQRPAAPFLCTYMGRSRNQAKPFRFIWNKSEATAANVYLLLYPRSMLATALGRDPSLYEVVFSALSGIEEGGLVGEGRVYGGGLHKVEPKELARVSAHAIVDAVKELQTTQQTQLAL